MAPSCPTATTLPALSAATAESASAVSATTKDDHEEPSRVQATVPPWPTAMNVQSCQRTGALELSSSLLELHPASPISSAVGQQGREETWNHRMAAMMHPDWRFLEALRYVCQ